MVNLKPTLLWWVLTRYHVWAIDSALLAAWAFVEMLHEPDRATGALIGLVFVLLCTIHIYIWNRSHRHRERVRGYIQRRVEDAEAQWRDDGRWWIDEFDDLTVNAYGIARFNELGAALRRPDLWGKWTLNVYCGETDTHFASGCDSWPRWVWEPVEQ